MMPPGGPRHISRKLIHRSRYFGESTFFPRTSVNKGRKEGRSSYARPPDLPATQLVP